MSMRNVLYMLLVIFIIAVTGVGLYNLFQGQRLLRDMIESMKHEKRVDIVKEAPVEPSVIERIVHSNFGIPSFNSSPFINSLNNTLFIRYNGSTVNKTDSSDLYS